MALLLRAESTSTAETGPRLKKNRGGGSTAAVALDQSILAYQR
jgi:hypothetical protein